MFRSSADCRSVQGIGTEWSRSGEGWGRDDAVVSPTAILDALTTSPITDEMARVHPHPLIKAQADVAGASPDTARAWLRTRAVVRCQELGLGAVGLSPEIDQWVEQQLGDIS